MSVFFSEKNCNFAVVFKKTIVNSIQMSYNLNKEKNKDVL